MAVEPLLGTRAQRAFILTSAFRFCPLYKIMQLTILVSAQYLSVRISFASGKRA